MQPAGFVWELSARSLIATKGAVMLLLIIRPVRGKRRVSLVGNSGCPASLDADEESIQNPGVRERSG